MLEKGVLNPAPKIKKSIKVGVRSIATGEILLLARLVVSTDGGIILSTPWKKRPGLFLSEFTRNSNGIVPVDSSTIRVGSSGVAKCHYHRSGWTSVQSEEGGERLSVQLPKLINTHQRQFAHIYTKFPGMLPTSRMLRKSDPVYIQDVAGMESLSVHIAVYNKKLVPEKTLGRAIDNFPVTFTTGDPQGVLVDVSSTGNDAILAFYFRGLGQFVPNSPEYSLNMFSFDSDEFLGAVGVQTEPNFARFGVLDRVPDLADIHDQNLIRSVTRTYPTSWTP